MSHADADHVESEVLDRYARGAAAVEPALCCATEGYDPKYLAALPQEILDKDYGCGDPSRYAQSGDVVVDLGSGAGKICYIIAQKVGAEGRVIGVDFNDAMLDLARKHQPQVAEQIGYDNVRFVKARIQNLADGLDADAPSPLIADASVDLIVSNCVLNLVRPQDKVQLFDEMFRVLKSGGRAVISDIVCDRDPTPAIRDDPKLWSGCISGAFREDRFAGMFEAAGFCCVETLVRQDEPWQTIDGVAFRSVTVRAWKDRKPDEKPAAKSSCCGGRC